MRYVLSNESSRSKIHVEYNGKIVTVIGEFSTIGFVSYINYLKWYPDQPMEIQDKIEFMREANRSLWDDWRIFFFETDTGYIRSDWQGNPLLHIRDGKIAALKFNCVCEIFQEIDNFHSISDFELFQKHIAVLLKTKELEARKRRGRKYGKTAENWYRCPKCKNLWRLIYPDFSFKGAWKRV